MGLAAKGTVITFGSTVARVRRFSHKVDGQQVDVTGLDSLEEEFISGFPSREITIECFGTPAIEQGDIQNLTIAVPTPKTFGPVSCECVSAETSGEAKGAISSSFTFRKAPTTT